MSDRPALDLDPRLARRLAAKKAELDTYRPLAPVIVHRLHADLQVLLTYHSNAIEGNTFSLRETQNLGTDAQLPCNLCQGFVTVIGELNCFKLELKGTLSSFRSHEHLLPRLYIQAYVGVHHSGGTPRADPDKIWPRAER